MPRVRVVHSTEYQYARPVRFTPHRLMLRPRDSHDLRVLDTTLGLMPPASSTRWAHDVFSNSVCTVEWGDYTSNTLRIVSRLDLQHYPSGTEESEATLDPGAETYPFSYAAEEFPDLARLLERHHPDPDRLIDAWARRFLRDSGRTPVMDLLTAMTRAIKADFIYAAREAEGTNPPVRTLLEGRGACRDLALLMMEACRSLGLATRFVSGYLYDAALVDSLHPMVGGAATHAWCAVYLPGAGWVEFDPTNGLIAGRNLIRICSGRTPEQAVPVAGGFIGGTGDFMNLFVNVEVTVGDQA
jgi:transglutaminase-like putative cysteine protease